MFWSPTRARHAQVTALIPALRRGPLGEGEVQAVPELEELVHRQASAAQIIENHGKSLLLAKAVVRIWDASYQGTAVGCGGDKKAELETRIYVGYIRYVCTTILFIPSMQINHILAFVCVCLCSGS